MVSDSGDLGGVSIYPSKSSIYDQLGVELLAQFGGIIVGSSEEIHNIFKNINNMYGYDGISREEFIEKSMRNILSLNSLDDIGGSGEFHYAFKPEQYKKINIFIRDISLNGEEATKKSVGEKIKNGPLISRGDAYIAFKNKDGKTIGEFHYPIRNGCVVGEEKTDYSEFYIGCSGKSSRKTEVICRSIFEKVIINNLEYCGD